MVCVEKLCGVERNGPVGRYAPSPTGPLHFGNLRTALLAHLQMEALGGLMILRVEDTDGPRNVAGAEAGIFRDLGRLGLVYDEGPDGQGGGAGPYRQSERDGIYWACLEYLGDQGLVYGCRCSRKDLKEASAPHGPDGLIYPGTCCPKELRRVGREELRQGDTAWRLRLDGFGELRWRDSYVGWVRERPADGGDFVIRRRDGLWAYQFVCAVDDWLMGVSHVLRGEDLFTSTGRQLAVIGLLGGRGPGHYCHVPLVVDGEGRRMSKRDGSAGLGTVEGVGLGVENLRRWILGLGIGP